MKEKILLVNNQTYEFDDVSIYKNLFTITFDENVDMSSLLEDMGNKLLDVVNAIFMVLAILGVVTDPTTAGITDSTQALEYTEPKKDEI